MANIATATFGPKPTEKIRQERKEKEFQQKKDWLALKERAKADAYKREVYKDFSRRYRKPKTQFSQMKEFRKSLAAGAGSFSTTPSVISEQAKVRAIIGLSSGGGTAQMAGVGSQGGFYSMVGGSRPSSAVQYQSEPEVYAPSQQSVQQGPAPPGTKWSEKSQRWVNYTRKPYKTGARAVYSQYQQY